MPKAKTIDRVEYTKKRSIVYHRPSAPVQRVYAEYDEGHGAVMERKSRDDVCPVCGAKLIHEAGCIRCTCGWSSCKYNKAAL